MPFSNKQSRDEFQKIQDLTKQIDAYIELKRTTNNFDNLKSVGKVIIDENSKFYSGGVSLGRGHEDSFSTLATEEENKNDLAKTFLALMYINWLGERKDVFEVAEIGAGSGDLMKEVLSIKASVLNDRNSVPDLQKFFNSLRFTIFDFDNMIKIQKEKIGETSDINFVNQDVSRGLLPHRHFDFIYGNEIPDTQRIDFLEVKTDAKGEKNYFMRSIKTHQNEKTEVLVKLSNELIDKIEESLMPIRDLASGLYQLQFGFHALLQNIRQGLKEQGSLMLTDYFAFQPDNVSRSLAFTSAIGSSDEFNMNIDLIKEPGEKIIVAKALYEGETLDITYSPAVGQDTCDKFGIKCGFYDPQDDRSGFVFGGQFTKDALTKILADKTLGHHFMRFLDGLKIKLMPTELTDTKCHQIYDTPSPDVRMEFSNINSISGGLGALR